jgi:hypothetical protein
MSGKVKQPVVVRRSRKAEAIGLRFIGMVCKGLGRVFQRETAEQSANEIRGYSGNPSALLRVNGGLRPLVIDIAVATG